jgi:hypothetical protein
MAMAIVPRPRRYGKRNLRSVAPVILLCLTTALGCHIDPTVPTSEFDGIHVARVKLGEWLAWARRSKLAPFVELARTIKKHHEGILAHVQTRIDNGRTEGISLRR